MEPFTEKVVFGNIIAGLSYQDRPAAYAVIANAAGGIAAVKGRSAWFLPGGGSLPDETPEATIHRELREELGRRVRLRRKLGTAVQYFSADGLHYQMQAVFYEAEFIDEPIGQAEYELNWLDPSQCAGLFLHPCHEWAIAQSRLR